MTDADYAFEDLPLGPIRPGTTVLLAGPSHAGTREIGFRMLRGPAVEGTIIVTTNQRATRIVDDCERVGLEVAPDRTAMLDCVGGADDSLPARVLPISGPSDLTGIGMRYADVYREFDRDAVERVRTGLFSVSTLLSFGDLQDVSRFVHTLVGRIDSVDGLGVFLVDPEIHDDQVVRTLSQFCAGRIDVREAADGPELRVRGVSEGSREWTPLEPLSK